MKIGKIVAIVGVLFFLSVTGLFFFKGKVLRSVVAPLTTQNSVDKADFIFVLMGDLVYRPYAAAELYRKNYAHKIIYCRTPSNLLEERKIIPSEHSIVRKILEDVGVAGEDILLLPGAPITSTVEEGLMLKDYLLTQEPRPKRGIIITSWDGGRPSWILKKIIEPLGIQLDFLGVDVGRYAQDNWWRSRESITRVASEYVKGTYYHWIFFKNGTPRTVAQVRAVTLPHSGP